MVTDKSLRSSIEIHVTVQTTHVEHILTLEIRGIAPTEHLYTDIVLSGTYISTYVEFVIIVTALCVAHILAIDPYESCTIKAVEVQEHILCIPACREVECTAV